MKKIYVVACLINCVLMISCSASENLLGSGLNQDKSAGSCVVYSSNRYDVDVSVANGKSVQVYAGEEFNVPANRRIVVVSHRKYKSGGGADVEIQRKDVVTGSWSTVVANNEEITGLNHKVSTLVNAGGTYRFWMNVNTGGSPVSLRYVVEVVSQGCKGDDTCFGAVGKNCSGLPGGFCKEDKGSSNVFCQVSVGSQIHDTCCSKHPDGEKCGGPNEGTDRSCLVDGEPYLCCKPDWDHALGDSAAGRYFITEMDPLEITYRGTKALGIAKPNSDIKGDRIWYGEPGPDALLFPDRSKDSPSKLWSEDGAQWCASGVSHFSDQIFSPKPDIVCGPAPE